MELVFISLGAASLFGMVRALMRLNHLEDAVRFSDKKGGRIYRLDKPISYVVSLVDPDGGIASNA